MVTAAASHRAIARTFKEEHGRVVATLMRLTAGDLQLAEDAAAEAFASALERWPAEGVPERPGAWLTTVARNRVLDRLRRNRTVREKAPSLTELARIEAEARRDREHPERAPAYPDDRLALMFTCCHPSLASEAQVGLTLRTLCGLSTAEIARAFLVPESTMAQRLVRAKKKIQRAGIPYRVPEPHELPERVLDVLRVIYLVFNEGYRATVGDDLVRRDLCAEAIHLGRVTHELMPAEPEAMGLCALMMLHHARRDARVDAEGDLVLLDDQDRGCWHGDEIERACRLLDAAILFRAPGPYQIQAAIAALHATAKRAEDTDWLQITALYGRLEQLEPSPVVSLNRAVALAMATEPKVGLEVIERLEHEGALANYALLHAARADLLRRSLQLEAAAHAYRRALELTGNEPERRFLRRRLREVQRD